MHRFTKLLIVRHPFGRWVVPCKACSTKVYLGLFFSGWFQLSVTSWNDITTTITQTMEGKLSQDSAEERRQNLAANSFQQSKRKTIISRTEPCDVMTPDSLAFQLQLCWGTWLTQCISETTLERWSPLRVGTLHLFRPGGSLYSTFLRRPLAGLFFQQQESFKTILIHQQAEWALEIHVWVLRSLHNWLQCHSPLWKAEGD